MTTPSAVYDYDRAIRGGLTQAAENPPPSHHPATMIAHRIMAKAHNCAEVRFRCFTARFSSATESAALLLYGSGAYGLRVPASFKRQPAVAGHRAFPCMRSAQIRGGTTRLAYLDGSAKDIPQL